MNTVAAISAASEPSARKTVRLVHTSDVHLGVDWKADLSERAFTRVIDCVTELGADALLVVGDVFDHARVPDRALKFYLKQIGRLDCPVITLPGNHDLYHDDSLYLREPFASAPANFYLVTGCDGQTIAFPELGLNLWGRAMRQHTPDFRPLAGMTPPGDGRWLVALAHGHFHFPEDKDLRSSPIQPFEVAAAPCDYLALGHWERHVEVSRGGTVAYYSGSPLGAAPDYDHISVNVVDLDPASGVRVQQAVLPITQSAPKADLVAVGPSEGGSI